MSGSATPGYRAKTTGLLRSSRASCVFLLLALVPHIAAAQEEPTPAASIPESKIASLKTELARSRSKRASSVDRRRACKSVARKGAALVEEYPTAPNRYDVLGLVLESEKRLLGLQNSDRNRKALFRTCSKIAQAPDEYAEIRLEADMLLSERDLQPIHP